jgi:excisionase family DNA binding protein
MRESENLTPTTVETPAKPWSISDVAEFLDVKESTIKKYVKHRGLPCMRPAGKLMYFDPAEVLAWLKQSGEAA